jgi:hypothetical protein
VFSRPLADTLDLRGGQFRRELPSRFSAARLGHKEATLRGEDRPLVEVLCQKRETARLSPNGESRIAWMAIGEPGFGHVFDVRTDAPSDRAMPPSHAAARDFQVFASSIVTRIAD